MNKLVGQRIACVLMDTAKERLIFVCGKESYGEGPTLVYTAVGGCCSHSWFAHFEGVEALKDAVVSSIEEIETTSNRKDDDSDDEVTEVYGYKIKTDKGVAQLEFRNESNGYYSGWLQEGFRDQYGTADFPVQMTFNVIENDF